MEGAWISQSVWRTYLLNVSTSKHLKYLSTYLVEKKYLLFGRRGGGGGEGGVDLKSLSLEYPIQLGSTVIAPSSLLRRNR